LARVVEAFPETHDALDDLSRHLMQVSLVAMPEAKREDSEQHPVECEEAAMHGGRQLENHQRSVVCDRIEVIVMR